MQYIRFTVIGSRRKADLALPDDQSVGELLPEIATVLDEPAASSPLVLTSLVGVPVDAQLTLADQDIDNGAVLRLQPLDFAPQPPDVAEVAEVVADATVERPDRWTAGLTSITVAIAVAVLAAASAAVLPLSDADAAWALTAIFALGALGGVVLARKHRTPAAQVAFALSLGVSLRVSQLAAQIWAPGAELVVSLMVVWLLVWVAVGLVFGLGFARRGLLMGAGVALFAGATGIWSVLSHAQADAVAAFVGVVAAALLGLAPTFALAFSGVARFDDAVIGAEPVRRLDVDGAITNAYAAQQALAVSLAVPLAVSIVLLLSGTGWHLTLAAALAAFALVRARLFPLAVSRIAILAAGMAPVVCWLLTTPALSAWSRVSIGAMACAVLGVTALLRFSGASIARFRKLLGVIEALAVIVMIPALLGVMGVFDDLLGVFG